jgi:hypothetical protein
MIVEVYDRMGNPHRIQATRVVIRNRHDDPMCVCLEQNEDHHFIKHCGEEGFEHALRAMGVNSTLVVDRHTPAGPLGDTGQIFVP